MKVKKLEKKARKKLKELGLHCCESYRRKAKMCGSCPLRSALKKKARKKLLRKVEEELGRT